MITLLILTSQSSLATAIQSVLDAKRYQIITKEDVWEAESLLGRGAIDVSIVDVELKDVRSVRLLEELKNAAPDCPVLLYTGSSQWEWEEDAYILGVTHVLKKPVRGRLLNTLLDRILSNREETPLIQDHLPRQQLDVRTNHSLSDHVRGLEALRDFSGLLTHSLQPDSLLKEFLLLLREIIGVNRAMIFLRKPGEPPSEAPRAQVDRWMRCACAIGLEHGLLDHFALSLSTGIGSYLYRQGRILRSQGAAAQQDREILKEFQLLGAQVAIPILDRESLIGVAVFDERLTGGSYSNEELSLIFHMLEEVGIALKNSWSHNQLVASHEMIVDILSQLGSGCIVVGANMGVLHANAAARNFFLPGAPDKRQLDFSDLPQELGSRIFAVMKTGQNTPPFQYQFPQRQDRFFEVNISSFKTKNVVTANAALLLIEDRTEHQKNQRLEIEASNLRLVKSMAEHLAHEIGNSLVPISTYQQLLTEHFEDKDFRKALQEALGEGVKRISRLASQMMFLSREEKNFADTVRVSQLVADAFKEADEYIGIPKTHLSFNQENEGYIVSGDQKALRQAFLEIMLNALQANPSNPNISVRLTPDQNNLENPQLSVEFQDSGEGFKPGAAESAPSPFFTTRKVGLGLGLTVSRKIIEDHQGKIEIAGSQSGPGIVRVSLPLAN
jgi:two-component system, sporulation sensor kinase E